MRLLELPGSKITLHFQMEIMPIEIIYNKRITQKQIGILRID